MNVVGLMVLMFCLVSSMNDLTPHGNLYIRGCLGLCVYILVRIQSSCPHPTLRRIIIILYNTQCAGADCFFNLPFR